MSFKAINLKIIKYCHLKQSFGIPRRFDALEIKELNTVGTITWNFDMIFVGNRVINLLFYCLKQCFSKTGQSSTRENTIRRKIIVASKPRLASMATRKRFTISPVKLIYVGGVSSNSASTSASKKLLKPKNSSFFDIQKCEYS